jgi:hypothetical protein
MRASSSPPGNAGVDRQVLHQNARPVLQESLARSSFRCGSTDFPESRADGHDSENLKHEGLPDLCRRYRHRLNRHYAYAVR